MIGKAIGPFKNQPTRTSQRAVISAERTPHTHLAPASCLKPVSLQSVRKKVLALSNFSIFTLISIFFFTPVWETKPRTLGIPGKQALYCYFTFLIVKYM